MEAMKGYRSYVAAVCLAIGGVGMILNGDVMEGVTAICNGLAVFGIRAAVSEAQAAGK